MVAGLPSPARVRLRVMGESVEVDRPRAGRHARGRRRHGAARDRPTPGPAHRRAHRAQLRLPPVRRRDGDLPLGHRARGHPGPRAGHPQDPARLAGAGEVRRPLRRGRQPPVQPVRPGDGQGQPRPRGRRRRAGVPGRRRRRTRAFGSRSRSPTSTSSASCWTSAAPRSCSTTWTARRWPRRCASPPAAPRSRRPEASRSSAPARWPQTGVDFISVGALTHSVKVFDLGLDLDET